MAVVVALALMLALIWTVHRLVLSLGRPVLDPEVVAEGRELERHLSLAAATGVWTALPDDGVGAPSAWQRPDSPVWRGDCDNCWSVFSLAVQTASEDPRTHSFILCPYCGFGVTLSRGGAVC